MMSNKQSIEMALRILTAFTESSLYEDYKNDDEDGFTDEEYQEMIDALDRQL